MKLQEKLETLQALSILNEFRVLDHIHFANFKFSMSVQASVYHYCRPKKTGPLGIYTHFEVMLNVPFKDIPRSWQDHTNDGDIYTYVPREKVEELMIYLDEKYIMV